MENCVTVLTVKTETGTRMKTMRKKGDGRGTETISLLNRGRIMRRTLKISTNLWRSKCGRDSFTRRCNFSLPTSEIWLNRVDADI